MSFFGEAVLKMELLDNNATPCASLHECRTHKMMIECRIIADLSVDSASNPQDDDSMTMCLSRAQDDDSMTMCHCKSVSRGNNFNDSQDDDSMTMCLSNSQDDSTVSELTE